MSDNTGKTVLLVGAGFLGKFFLSEWLGNPYNKLIVMDKQRKGDFFGHPLLQNYEKDDRITYVWGSSGDPQQLEKFFKEDKIDHIVYTAAIADVPYARTNPRDTQITNIDNLGIFLNYIGDQHFTGKIVLMSSESVYAKKPEGTPEEDIPFKETDSTEGHSIYGKSKLGQEEQVHLAEKKYEFLNATIIRSATMYGMFARAEQVIPTFIRQVLTKEQITLFGDGKQTSRDFIHVTDTVNGIIAILNANDSVTSGQTFNIASGRETFLLNLANAIKTLVGQPTEAFDAKKGIPASGFVPIKFLDFLPGEKGARMVLNIEKAKKNLKMIDHGKEVAWEPQVDLINGLRSTIFWTCSVIGYDEQQMEEVERVIYPEHFKGRSETNPLGNRA